MSVICNLSQGIEDKGIAIGEAREKTKIIIGMYNKGFILEQIAAAIDNDIKVISAMIKSRELELV